MKASLKLSLGSAEYVKENKKRHNAFASHDSRIKATKIGTI